MEKLCSVYITASTKEEALKIADEVVARRLAACANVYDGVTSVYWWEGKKQKDEEAVLILKTRESLMPVLQKAVKELHSYSCPCIVAHPIIYSSKDYADWIIKETKDAS